MQRPRALLAFASLSSALLLACASPQVISAVEARKWVAEGARLVDVRSPEEFAAGHISGAVNIPVSELERRLSELGPPQTPVVVYCRSGMRSRRAAGLLKEKGYQRVGDLGGMSRWGSD